MPRLVEYDEFLYLMDDESNIVENLGPGYLTPNGAVFYKDGE